MKRRVLICGAGVGGLTAAFWLHRWGFLPTVVESLPSLRDGGYLVDFFGAGYDVAERMGLVASLRRHDLRLKEADFVYGGGGGADAHRQASLRKQSEQRALRSASLPRGALIRVLHDAVKGVADVELDDRPLAIEETSESVRVQLERGGERTYDLVIGADGVSSNVRRLVFGHDDQYVTFFGFYAASFTVAANAAEQSFATSTAPGRKVAIYPVGDDRVAAFFLFSSEHLAGIESHGARVQLRALREVFRGHSPRTEDLLSRAQSATDFSFEPVSQVRMPEWAKSRVALVGDACACPSLLSGQGASMAMAGAYVLAGELNEAAGGHRSAFARYQHIMKRYAESQQDVAARVASRALPSSRAELLARKLLQRVVSDGDVAARVVKLLARNELVLRPYE